MQMQPIPGSQIPNQSGATQSTPQSSATPTVTGYGIAAFVCGLFSLFIPVFGFVLAIAAIAFFFVQKSKGGTTGFAITGLILGILGILLLPMLLAISYFGVLNPDKFLPDKCIFGTGIGGCMESALVNDVAMARLVNNIGQDITITKATATVSGLSESCTPTVTMEKTQWLKSEANNLKIEGCKIWSGERMMSRVTLEYTTAATTYPKTIEGELVLKKQ